jgi:hypothetical protein
MDRRALTIGMGVALAARPAFGDAPAVSNLKNAAGDAWLFTVPLIAVAALRARANASGGRPAFRHSRSLAGPTNRDVTTPNNAPLYSNAFVDTTKGPVRSRRIESR